MMHYYYYITFKHDYVIPLRGNGVELQIRDKDGAIRKSIEVGRGFKYCRYYKDVGVGIDLNFFIHNLQKSKGFIVTLNDRSEGTFFDNFIPFELFKWMQKTYSPHFNWVRMHSFSIDPPPIVYRRINKILSIPRSYTLKIVPYYKSPSQLTPLKR